MLADRDVAPLNVELGLDVPVALIDPTFVNRVGALLREADDEARESAPIAMRRRVRRSGRCAACGATWADQTPGCLTCRMRHYMRAYYRRGHSDGDAGTPDAPSASATCSSSTSVQS